MGEENKLILELIEAKEYVQLKKILSEMKDRKSVV